MIIIVIVLAVLLLAFGGVVLVGAPYLPTLKPQVMAALELADLKPGQTLLELGCGDGRVVLAAARRGYQVIGYELNPFLVLIARLQTFRYRPTAKIIWGDFWQKSWPEADAIFIFLLPRYMKKLDTKVIQYNHKPVKLVSFAFQIPGKKFISKKAGVFVYHYR
jgi:SAM-dependent methyltransferase